MSVTCNNIIVVKLLNGLNCRSACLQAAASMAQRSSGDTALTTWPACLSRNILLPHLQDDHCPMALRAFPFVCPDAEEHAGSLHEPVNSPAA